MTGRRCGRGGDVVKGDKEKGRGGDTEKGRHGEGETRRRGDKERGRRGEGGHGEGETRRRGDKERGRLNHIPHLTFHIRHITSHIRHPTSQIRHPISESLRFNPFARINYFSVGNNTPDIHPCEQLACTYLLMASCYFLFTHLYAL